MTPQGFHPAKRILISSQMGIGNMVLFLPFLQALRQAYPNAYLGALFSSSNGADLLLKSLDPRLVLGRVVDRVDQRSQ